MSGLPTGRSGRVPHGGDLAEAGAASGSIWLDLSTGINPHAYPAAIGMGALHALPQSADEARLVAAARAAYRVPKEAGLVAAPGTQAIIQWLPHLMPARRVAILGPTYQEHEAAWERTAEVRVHDRLDPDAADLWVVVNPNNPDGRRIDAATLAGFARTLAQGRGREHAARGEPVLVVDEAFMDPTPGETVAGAPGTLVMRSFGKFYGLAGLRLGFAVGAPATLARLAEALGPWAVGTPALKIGADALADAVWAETMRARLARERAALDAMLGAAGFAVAGGTDLFCLAAHPHAQRWHARLAAAGVWTRRFDDHPTWLRFGLPGTAAGRFADTLATLARTA